MGISSIRLAHVNPKVMSRGPKSRVRSILAQSTGLRSVMNPWSGMNKGGKAVKFSKIAGRLNGGM